MSEGTDKQAKSVSRAVRIRRLGRWVLVVGGGAVAVVLLTRPTAIAGDLLSNVGPASQLRAGSLMDAYPLGHYVLDHHFAAVKAGVLSGVDVSGIPPTIALFLANMLWQLTAFLAHTLITLFTFAFSLDLVGGSGATGGASALEPVSRAVRSIYRQTFGEPWLIVAVLLAGLWAIYNALVRRRYVETAGSLAMSVVFVVIALAFVTQPERTIGSASKWSNAMSGAFLSLTSNGSVSDPARAKQGAADQLFTLLVYDPWTVLQFGGREHCVKTPVGDKPQSVPVRPLSKSPGRDAELSRRLQRSEGATADGKACVSDRNKYAPRFLRFSSGSDERDQQYEALKNGDRSKLDDDPAKNADDYRLGPADKPAAEAMGKGGQYERLLMAIVIFGGELGIFLLLGALSVSVILAQVLVLLLMAFAPVALVVGVFPGRGHEFFLGWLSRLGAFLLRKAIYSLILAVLLAVGAAIDGATSSLGWLMAFGLQGAFFWAVFLYRSQLTGHLTLATTGTKSAGDHSMVRLAALYAAARVARRVLPSHGTAGTRPAAPRAQASESPTPPDDPAWREPTHPEPPPSPSGPNHDGNTNGAAPIVSPPDAPRPEREDTIDGNQHPAVVTPERAASPLGPPAPGDTANGEDANAAPDKASPQTTTASIRPRTAARPATSTSPNASAGTLKHRPEPPVQGRAEAATDHPGSTQAVDAAPTHPGPAATEVKNPLENDLRADAERLGHEHRHAAPRPDRSTPTRSPEAER